MKYKKTKCVKEAVIQAELYVACRKADLCCDLQYIVNPNQWCIPVKHRKETSVFDLVITEGNDVIAIVEVKTPDSISISISVENSEQITRYKKHDVPVFVLYSIYDIPYLVKELVEVRSKFLESIDLATVECFESDKQSEKNWDNKITKAFGRFDEVFPDYKFTSSRSLESLADGVKVLGLEDVLKLMDDYVGDSTSNFFLVFDELVTYRKSGPSRFLNERKGNIKTLTQYQERQDKITKKFN